MNTRSVHDMGLFSSGVNPPVEPGIKSGTSVSMGKGVLKDSTIIGNFLCQCSSNEVTDANMTPKIQSLDQKFFSNHRFLEQTSFKFSQWHPKLLEDIVFHPRPSF